MFWMLSLWDANFEVQGDSILVDITIGVEVTSVFVKACVLENNGLSVEVLSCQTM